uniref:Ixodegrin B n=1 Tax=Rhipicephalus appendiculatus TaxID=34631 RepID=A0A131Z724_RHIAP
MTHTCRYLNVVCITLLLSRCLVLAAHHNRHKLTLQEPRQKVVRSSGQLCSARSPCIMWTCCRNRGGESRCYPRTRRGGICSNAQLNGTYLRHCPCAPGHGRCLFGSCKLENTNRHHYRQRL